MDNNQLLNANLLFKLRQSHFYRRYAPEFQRLRAVFTFGPWRHLWTFLLRLRYRLFPVEMTANLTETITLVNSQKSILSSLGRDGFARVGQLKPDTLRALQEDTANLPAKEYAMTHRVNSAIKNVINDENIHQFMIDYFGYKPFLRESSLTITRGDGDLTGQAQNSFHQDYAGAKSLNLFVYLTDVGEHDPYHEVLLGSHRRSFWHAWYHYPLAKIRTFTLKKRYRAYSILGSAGTVFLENTEALHRRNLTAKRRVMLNVLFSATPGLVADGRFTQTQIRNDGIALSRE